MDVILRDRRAILVFVGPALLAYTLILLGPILWSIAYTFFTGNGDHGFHVRRTPQLQHIDPRPGVLGCR